MGKEKIKIRYIIFVLITMGVIFFGKITRLDNLNAEKIAGIILVSPPYKKRITGQQKIEEFTILFNDEKRNLYSQSLHPNGRDKGAIISMETYQYNIIFCGENITVNRPKYVMDKLIDFELDQFLKNIINKAPLRWMPPG
ncbi:MAG: hypothetical protein V8S98_05055 [Lachnospiraceae bacterium]